MRCDLARDPRATPSAPYTSHLTHSAPPSPRRQMFGRCRNLINKRCTFLLMPSIKDYEVNPGYVVRSYDHDLGPEQDGYVMPLDVDFEKVITLQQESITSALKHLCRHHASMRDTYYLYKIKKGKFKGKFRLFIRRTKPIAVSHSAVEAQLLCNPRVNEATLASSAPISLASDLVNLMSSVQLEGTLSRELRTLIIEMAHTEHRRLNNPITLVADLTKIVRDYGAAISPHQLLSTEDSDSAMAQARTALAGAESEAILASDPLCTEDFATLMHRKEAGEELTEDEWAAVNRTRLHAQYGDILGEPITEDVVGSPDDEDKEDTRRRRLVKAMLSSSRFAHFKLACSLLKHGDTDQGIVDRLRQSGDPTGTSLIERLLKENIPAKLLFIKELIPLCIPGSTFADVIRGTARFPRKGAGATAPSIEQVKAALLAADIDVTVLGEPKAATKSELETRYRDECTRREVDVSEDVPPSARRLKAALDAWGVDLKSSTERLPPTDKVLRQHYAEHCEEAPGAFTDPAYELAARGLVRDWRAKFKQASKLARCPNVSNTKVVDSWAVMDAVEQMVRSTVGMPLTQRDVQIGFPLPRADLDDRAREWYLKTGQHSVEGHGGGGESASGTDREAGTNQGAGQPADSSAESDGESAPPSPRTSAARRSAPTSPNDAEPAAKRARGQGCIRDLPLAADDEWCI